MFKMNINAKPFVPKDALKNIKIENDFFDALESEWVKNNQYIFEDPSIESVLKQTKNTHYEKCIGDRIKMKTSVKVLSTILEVSTYASII
jgi:hypothetical protein